MKFSDKNTFGKEIKSKRVSSEEVCSEKSWDEVEGKEIEMINGMDLFIGNCSQHICDKSKQIMKQWRNNQ